MTLPLAARRAAVALLLAALAACQTTPPAPSGPGTPQRDGAEAKPPPDLAAVPDAVPQIEPIRNGGPNKPYEIGGHTYVPLTDDRALTEKGLASWYGKKFHGRRTASGEAYNMYAMTAAHKTLPIPSYARVRNPANGHEVIVRVNDRGPFVRGRIIDLSYTAALKLGVLNGVASVEISRITSDDIRTGAAFRKAPVLAAAPAADAPAASPTSSVVREVPATAGEVVAAAADASRPGGGIGAPAGMPSTAPAPGVDLGAAAAADAGPPAPGTVVTTVTETVSSVVTPVTPANARADKPDEHTHADTTAGAGWWIQLGAYRQREGALDFQRRLVEEQPWLGPLLAVFSDHGLNKLQAGPYTSRDDARSAADRVRASLQLVPTLVEKR